ncbi:hypothetical protein BGZ60DRAFT_530445 [Tricladium varicosporioides]|nr:hypothetical protein BGZ60DRAFT_530445 [Hymenoscyphus varicosporioides]
MSSYTPNAEVDQFGNPIQNSSQGQVNGSGSSQRPNLTMKISSTLDKSKSQQPPQATVKMSPILDKPLLPQIQIMPSHFDKSIRPQTQAMPSKLDKTQHQPSSSKQQTYDPPSASYIMHQSNTSKQSIFAKAQSYAPRVISIAVPPQKAQSVFQSQYDIEMAQKQTRMETLTPQEKQQQEQWAQSQLNTNASVGACIMGFTWYRQSVKIEGIMTGGYRCHGGSHFVSDKLLATGQGGYYTRLNIEWILGEMRKDMYLPHQLPIPDVPWVGPFYSGMHHVKEDILEDVNIQFMQGLISNIRELGGIITPNGQLFWPSRSAVGQQQLVEMNRGSHRAGHHRGYQGKHPGNPRDSFC